MPGGCFFVAAANELDDRPGTQGGEENQDREDRSRRQGEQHAPTPHIRVPPEQLAEAGEHEGQGRES
jgi:hypothetical protein